MQIIPITNDAQQVFTTVLNGQAVRISAWFQTIGNGWYLSVDMIDGTPIIEGTRVNSQSPVFHGLVTEFLGDIIAVPIDTPFVEPVRDAWGVTHNLVYITPEESEELGFETI